MHAYQRAVELSIYGRIITTSIKNVHIPMGEDEARQFLTKLHPHLIKILLSNIDVKIESLKIAVLKSIEYIID